MQQQRPCQLSANTRSAYLNNTHYSCLHTGLRADRPMRALRGAWKRPHCADYEHIIDKFSIPRKQQSFTSPANALGLERWILFSQRVEVRRALLVAVALMQQRAQVWRRTALFASTHILIKGTVDPSLTNECPRFYLSINRTRAHYSEGALMQPPRASWRPRWRLDGPAVKPWLPL